MDAFDEAWSILKARSFHRQRVLPIGSDKHMRLQQWANRHPTQYETQRCMGCNSLTTSPILMT